MIARSFCFEGQLNRTFQVSPSQWREAEEFLCQNLSAVDLKAFLIEVQQQLDEKFVENTGPVIADLINNGVEVMKFDESIQREMIDGF